VSPANSYFTDCSTLIFVVVVVIVIIIIIIIQGWYNKPTSS
jgi:hypothetical protein